MSTNSLELLSVYSCHHTCMGAHNLPCLYVSLLITHFCVLLLFSGNGAWQFLIILTNRNVARFSRDEWKPAAEDRVHRGWGTLDLKCRIELA